MPEHTTDRWQLPYPQLEDGPPDIPDYWRRQMLKLDGTAMFDSGTLDERPTSSSASPGIRGRFFLVDGEDDSPRIDFDYGTGWKKLGPWVGREEHINVADWDDETSPPQAAGSIIGEVPALSITGRPVSFLGIAMKCTTYGSSPTRFAIVTDHNQEPWGYATVSGLDNLTPVAGRFQEVTATAPIVLARMNAIALRLLNPGNSLGVKIGFIFATDYA